MREVGALVGREARARGVDVVLGPVLNLIRSPLGGRGFECYSEDPWLAGTLGAAWVLGVQGEGAAACPKHFVANDTETRRRSLDAVIDERTLREVYLLPFELALEHAWALMAAYNRVNGVPCHEHALLRELVRGEWGWDGAIVSEWYAVADGPASARAGVDLKMPGPPREYGPALERAVAAGQGSSRRRSRR